MFKFANSVVLGKKYRCLTLELFKVWVLKCAAILATPLPVAYSCGYGNKN